MTSLSEMMKKAQEMQAKMGEMQENLDKMTVEGVSGAGMIKLTLDGKGTLKSVKIDPEIFNAEDAEMVEDLIVAAHNEAKRNLDEKMQEEMSSMTGGLNLPDGFKMPF